jgi:hypothetical protein
MSIHINSTLSENQIIWRSIVNKYEVIVLMLEYFLQHCPKGCTKKIPSTSKFTAYRAATTGSEILNSILCGLYLKRPRKFPQNLLFS